jgi:hypothetical protein
MPGRTEVYAGHSTKATTTPRPSSSARQWRPWPPPRPSEGSPWIKWSDCPPGFSLEGRYGGPFKGKFDSLCAKIAGPDGAETKFPLPIALERRLEGLPAGAYVRIQYLGLQPSKEEGKAFHGFNVEVDAASVPELVSPDDDEVPF